MKSTSDGSFAILARAHEKYSTLGLENPSSHEYSSWSKSVRYPRELVMKLARCACWFVASETDTPDERRERTRSRISAAGSMSVQKRPLAICGAVDSAVTPI